MRSLLLLLLLLVALPAQAQSIVATVNDEAITSSDLEGRVRLALLGSGIKPDAPTIEKLREQILRQLVDERIQLQEAKRLNITVPDKDITDQETRLAQQNNMAVEQLPSFFARAGVPINSLEDQLRAGLAWGKVVQRVLRPQVNITEEEVDAEVARINANAGRPEYLVAEVFLPVDSPQQEDKVHQTAARLLDQISKGARFSTIARQFSQSPTAAASGDLGWVRPGQLDPELDAALAQMKPGTVSPPIRTAGGYHLVMLREVRLGQRIGGASSAAPPVSPPPPPPAPPPASAPPPAASSAPAAGGGAPATFTLRQVRYPLPANPTSADLHKAAERLKGLQVSAKNCNDMARFAKAVGDPTGGNLGTLSGDEIPQAIRATVAKLPDNKPSPLMSNDGGVLFLMVCARTAAVPSVSAPHQPASQPAPASPPPAPPPVSAPTPAPTAEDNAAREQLINTLGGQKLELLARRYMRDLRQSAFVEIRN